MRAFILSPINTLKSIIILKLRLRKKPQGLMINILAHDEYDFLFAFAEAVIALGNKFHIYLPPNRKIIRILSNINSRALAEVRKTITSGGVAILLHSVERKDFYLFSKKIKYDGPKIVIYKLKTKIFLEINTEKYLINCSDDKSMALVFWDYLLKSIVATI